MPTLLATAEASDPGIIGIELSVVALVSVAALVAIVVRRMRIPYTVALVLVGLALSLVVEFDVEISSDLILAVLVPPLIFEATIHLPWRRLKADIAIILTFAIGGTLIGTALVAGLVRPFTDLTWPAALAFGALVSATDPVAVIALFRTLGVSKRLTTLVEGESLFNDGVAIVVFNLALMASLPGAAALTAGGAVGEFIKVAFGGLGVGLVLGYVVSNIVLRNLDDHLIETAVTVALAFGSYLAAEEFGQLVGVDGLHLSGILAVVAAGLVVGSRGLQNTSPTTRLTLENFWEFLSFVVNSLVFLLIGLRIEIDLLGAHLDVVVLAVGTILLVRAVIVYGTAAVHNRLEATRHIPSEFQHVLYWGGLRGAVSLALALTLTDVFDPVTATVLQVMTFGVVLFTLLVQGTTINTLIARLGIAGVSAAVVDQQRIQAQIYAKQAAKRELERLRREGVLPAEIWAPLDELYDTSLGVDQADLDQHLQRYPQLETSLFLQARADALQAERGAIQDATRRGLVSSEVAEELATDLDHQLAALTFLQRRLTGASEVPREAEPPPYEGDDG